MWLNLLDGLVYIAGEEGKPTLTIAKLYRKLPEDEFTGGGGGLSYFINYDEYREILYCIQHDTGLWTGLIRDF